MATSSAFAAMKPASPPTPRPPPRPHRAERGEAGRSRSLPARLSGALAPPAKAPPLHTLLKARRAGGAFPAALLALITLLTAAAALSIAALAVGHSGRLLHYRGRVVRLSLGGAAPITLDEASLRGGAPVRTGYSRYEPSPGQFSGLDALSLTSRRLGIALAAFLAISAAAAVASALAAAAGYRGRPAWAVVSLLIPFTVFGLLVATYLSSLAALAGGLRARAGGFLGGLVQADVSAMQKPGAAWACAAASCSAWLFAVLAALLVPRGG